MKSKKFSAVAFFVLLAVAIPLMIFLLRTQKKATILEQPRNFALIRPGETIDEIVRKAARVVPTASQAAWQEREAIAFIHFGINTFTNREWGEGSENPALFNPATFDARQWARVIKEAGLKMIILTAKHHDGFCLWPTAFTDHSVKSSPWRGGKGDVVAETAAACREFGLALGIYLSPWDRHEPSYGDSPRYNEHFRAQLRELLTNYGRLDEVWFDGACGEGPSGKRQEYDWASYFQVVRELQPQAVIFGMGPDVRWVGTESGYGRETEWSVVPLNLRNLEGLAAAPGPFPLDGHFVPGDLTGPDLGSREKIAPARTLAWYPAETDVSIRPGWFYHPDQDDKVKTPGTLVDIYYSSAGRNGVLLLNIPPDTRGLIHDNDAAALSGMRSILDETFRVDLAAGSVVRASSESRAHPPAFIIDGDPETYWTAEDGVESARIEFDFPAAKTFDRARLEEYFRIGQRVEKFSLEAWDGQAWRVFAQGTTIGAKRLLRFAPVTAARIRLVLEQSRTNPTLAAFGLYQSSKREESR